MQRVKRATAVAVLPAAPGGGTPGFFALPNPGGGIPATVPGYEWYNGMQEEVMAVIEGAGLAPDATKNNQLATAIQSGKLYSSAAGGSADALTGTFTPAIGALINGMGVYIRAASANTTTAPTFTPNSGTIAAKTIVKGNGLALSAGDIAGAGHWIELQYDLTLDRWVLLNPANGINALGYGQTVQNVIGSRAWATVYTNSTGKPIFVSVISSVLAAGACVVISVNGISFFGTSCYDTSATHGSSAFAIVPPGGTYSVFCSTAGNGTLIAWSELR